MKLIRIALISAVSAVLLSACSTSSPDVVRSSGAMRMSTIQDARVVAVRQVVVDGQQSGLGAVSGAVVGGLAGRSIGGRRESRIFGVLGAVAGAVVGNSIERNSTREQAVEIVLQMSNGERRSLVQAVGRDEFSIGDSVSLYTSGGQTRVVKIR